MLTASHPPGASAHGVAPSPRRSGRLDRWLVRWPLITATFISKLAIPPFGAAGISVAIPVISATAAVGLASGRLVLHPARLMAFAALMLWMWGVQLVLHDGFSLPSMLMLTVLHAPYVLVLRDRVDMAHLLAGFQAVALGIGVLGLLQYALQFVLGPTLVFPIENLLPAAFRVAAFNMQGNLAYGSEVYRANGVFMLEPSFFSQLMALAVVVELATLRRWWFMALLTVAMLVSYSGTGVAMLAISLLALSVARGHWRWLLALVLAGALLLAAASGLRDVPYLGLFLARIGEFNSQGSSGFARFVGGFYMFEQFLWPEPLRALLGFGAGSFQAYAPQALYPATAMALFKMMFEFGVLGSLAYFGFLLWCVSRAPAPGVVRAAVALTYFLNGNYVPFAHGLALALLIWPEPLPAAGSSPEVA